MKKYLIIALAIATLALGATSANAAFGRNLTVGSTGADVSELQALLISKGFNIPSISQGTASLGYFGSQTKAAVVAYQTSHGIPGTGFVGPLTLASLNTNTTVTPNPVVICPVGFICKPDTTTGIADPLLRGDFGMISNVNMLSQYNNEEIGEGQKNVRVLGFDVEASNDGDILLRSLKLSIDPDGTTGSKRLNRYVGKVTVWQDTKVIGSANASDFTRGNNDVYSKTIVLTGNPIVKADQKKNFYITIDAINSLDSRDIQNDSWSISLDSIRFEDGAGVVTTENNIGELGQVKTAIDFVNFSQAANTKFKVSLDSNSPKEGVVIIDGDSTEDDVVLLAGSIRVEGKSDVTIDKLPVTITGSGVNDVDSIVGSLTLKIDGKIYRKSISTSSGSAVITFDRLNLNVDAGDTIQFSVLADINRFQGEFGQGDGLSVSITSTNISNIDVENEEGDQLASNTRSGSALGKTLEFREDGIAISLVKTDTSVLSGQSTSDDIGSFTLRFKVTAIGDTVYLASTTNENGFNISVDKAGSVVSTGLSGIVTNITDSRLTSNNNYRIEEGESETFEVTITANLPEAGTAGLYRAALTGIKWDNEDKVILDNTYTSNLDSYKTNYIVLN